MPESVTSEVIPIRRVASPNGDLIFVHGLGGDPYATWGFDRKNSWHTWIAANRPDLNIWSIRYRVEPTEWTGGAMPLADRALNILALMDNRLIGSRPIVFIGHSMGGLLVKEVLRHALTVTTNYRPVVERTRAVIFFSTPHTGSSLADLATYFSFVFRASAAVNEITSQQSRLRDLNLWYRNNYESLGLKSCIFFETKQTTGVRVVNETSADPGIPLCSPIPVDANHFDICRPQSYDDVVVGQTLKTIDSAIPNAEHSFDPDHHFEDDSGIEPDPATPVDGKSVDALQPPIAAPSAPAPSILSVWKHRKLASALIVLVGLFVATSLYELGVRYFEVGPSICEISTSIPTCPTPHPGYQQIFEFYSPSIVFKRSMITRMMEALCVSPSDIELLNEGEVSEEVRAQISIFKDTTRSRIGDKLSYREVYEILDSGTCHLNLGRNYFERVTFFTSDGGPARLRNFISQLNKLPPNPPYPLDASLDSVRPKIRALRADPNVSARLKLTLPSRFSDQVTRDLFMIFALM